jgi:hypothetical protein
VGLLCNVSVSDTHFTDVRFELRNVSLELRNVSLELRNVRLETRGPPVYTLRIRRAFVHLVSSYLIVANAGFGCRRRSGGEWRRLRGGDTHTHGAREGERVKGKETHLSLCTAHTRVRARALFPTVSPRCNPYCVFPACQYHPYTAGPRATEVGYRVYIWYLATVCIVACLTGRCARTGAS